MIRRVVFVLAAPTVYDVIVQLCRLFSSRHLAGCDAAEIVAALCHPTEGATP